MEVWAAHGFAIYVASIPVGSIRARCRDQAIDLIDLDEFATPGRRALAGDLECHLPSRFLRDCVPIGLDKRLCLRANPN